MVHPEPGCRKVKGKCLIKDMVEGDMFELDCYRSIQRLSHLKQPVFVRISIPPSYGAEYSNTAVFIRNLDTNTTSIISGNLWVHHVGTPAEYLQMILSTTS